MSQLRVIYSAEEVEKRISEMAAKIAEDYKEKDLLLVGILKGGAFLLVDLARKFPYPVEFEFVDVTSTPGDQGEEVILTYATHVDVSNRHVLILKDVLHSGVTENYLITHLSQQNPASIEVGALVDRLHQRSVNLSARYAAFDDAPDGMLVGYGLGIERDMYANRPDLCVIEDE